MEAPNTSRSWLTMPRTCWREKLLQPPRQKRRWGRSRPFLPTGRDGPGFNSLKSPSFRPIDIDPNSPKYGHLRATTKQGWSGPTSDPGFQRTSGVPHRRSTPTSTALHSPKCGGAAAGDGRFAYITVGTGVGVGLIVNGKPTQDSAMPSWAISAWRGLPAMTGRGPAHSTETAWKELPQDCR